MPLTRHKPQGGEAVEPPRLFLLSEVSEFSEFSEDSDISEDSD